ncbi:hypothetical protein PFX98_16895 [Paucibacter sediminis]|uniref:Lipoprotein n=1 Tax=Paucibacter sediminis TaxID=3019553 RepID=A0AA95SP76_9BURK|nr:hypothetical protein [Paucibacter sp. S2-9]WIT10581.1 hypothetical protein PFX98_16895 [Paucibacter sp. S2-9]
MKLTALLPRLLLCSAALASGAAFAYDRSPEIGFSLSVAQPGVYGRIDIGPQQIPRVYYPQTVLVQPAAVAYRPMYIYAPEPHVRHWRDYCRQYGACDRPVYFVRDEWVRENYRHEHRHGRGHGHGHGHD